MTNRTQVPSFHLDASRLGDRHGFDEWREAVRDIYDVEPLSVGPNREEKVTAWLAGNLIFSDVAFSPQSFNHHSHHLENGKYLSFQIYRKGACRGIFGDAAFEVAPDEIHIFDFSREFRSVVSEPSVVAGVIIPHEAVGYDPGLHAAYMKLPGTLPVGRFLVDSFFALKNQLPDVQQGEASKLAEGFCSLVHSLMICEQPDRAGLQGLQSDRGTEIKAYVDRHLSTPGLDVDHLCRTFNVSRSSLYRKFAATGGVSQYITHRRLDRIFHQLMSSPPSRGRVKEIADRWGFEDPGYFSRCFRQRFGVPPSKALGAGPEAFRTALPGVEGGQQMGAWLKSI